MQTLATFPLQSRSATQGFLDAQPSPFLESLFPNQQGPIATIIRIVLKLRQQTWVPEPFRLLLGKDAWGAGKKRDELTSKAVKVVDLLDYAIELGHVEAMYKLAQISLVSFRAFGDVGNYLNHGHSFHRTPCSVIRLVHMTCTKDTRNLRGTLLHNRCSHFSTQLDTKTRFQLIKRRHFCITLSQRTLARKEHRWPLVIGFGQASE